MSADELPTLFVSHGAPTLPLENVPARRFLATLGNRYRNVHAIPCVSAHWNTSRPAVNAVEVPETIHDFFTGSPLNSTGSGTTRAVHLTLPDGWLILFTALA